MYLRYKLAVIKNAVNRHIQVKVTQLQNLIRDKNVQQFFLAPYSWPVFKTKKKKKILSNYVFRGVGLLINSNKKKIKSSYKQKKKLFY